MAFFISFYNNFFQLKEKKDSEERKRERQKNRKKEKRQVERKNKRLSLQESNKKETITLLTFYLLRKKETKKNN